MVNNNKIYAERILEWHKIVAVRNIAAHGYWELDNKQIWEAVVSDVPVLKQYLQSIKFF